MLNEIETAYAMSLIRSEIEFRQIASQYQVVKLYCDWMAHPEICRNIYGFQILQQLTDAIMFYGGYKTIDPPDHNLFFPAIYKVLVEPLRQQLNKFADEYKISTMHFSDRQKWPFFFYCVTANLLDRAIKFPPDPITLAIKMRTIQ